MHYLGKYRLYETSPASFGGGQNFGVFRRLIEEAGYNADEDSIDMSTPVFIGNREGGDVARLMAIDGWNQDGRLTSSHPSYSLPFQDTTQYAPKMTRGQFVIHSGGSLSWRRMILVASSVRN